MYEYMLAEFEKSYICIKLTDNLYGKYQKY